MLQHLSVDGNTPELVDAEAMRRSAAKIEGFEESLGAVARAVSALHASSHSYRVGGAQPSILPLGTILDCDVAGLLAVQVSWRSQMRSHWLPPG